MISPNPPSPAALSAHEFPITAEYAYLNTATQGPLPDRARRAVEAALIRAQFPDTPRSQANQPMVEAARSGMAELLRVAADQIVFTANTTTGLNICAYGIDWRPGDNVVLPDMEFPSVMYTWQNLRTLGVDVRLVPWCGAGPDVDTLMAAVDSRTRVVSCSAVSWDSGFMIDLENLGRRCARAGSLLVVDGIQAVGAVELDLAALRVSALATHGYKWLTSGFGCGALYVAPDAIDQIRPRFVAESSHISDGESVSDQAAWQPGARRYTVGGANFLGLTALCQSLALIAEVGLPVIAAHNRELTQLLVAGLRRHAPDVRLVSPDDPARRAAIVVFTLGDRERDAELVRRLSERGVFVALRRRGVRVSPHFYNSGVEIERLLEVIPAALAAVR